MNTQQLAERLRLAAIDLPEKFSLYEVGDQVLFPIFGVTNSPTTTMAAFIVRRGESKPPNDGVFPSVSGGAALLGKGDWMGAPLRFGTLSELPSREDISAMFTLAVAACNDLHHWHTSSYRSPPCPPAK